MNTVLITGASSGIGRATAMAIGRLGDYRLILVVRNYEAGQRVAKRLSSNSEVGVFVCDLSSLSDVAALSKELIKSYSKIDVLVNNAGSRFDAFQESKDGIELTFATNHLGHFLLTNLLFNELAEPPKRVISVSSSAHRQARPEAGWNCAADRYDRKIAYANSKLANILFAKELVRRWGSKNLLSFAIDPGACATRFGRNNGLVAWTKHLLSHTLAGDLKSAENGAATIAFLATDRSVDRFDGKLVRGRKAIEPSSLAKDRRLATELWRESEILAST